MAEYIERTERLVLALNAGARAIENNKRLAGTTYVMDVFSENPKEISYYEAAKLLREVSETAGADVVPVRHGHWIKTASYGRYECSECHGADTDCSDYYGTHDVRSQEWCPFCGARMDGGADDGE